MSKSFKTAVSFVVIALVLTAAVSAQSNLQSNTNKATAGVFTSDVDDSMDVHYYTDVKFDKWLGFIGYGGNQTTNPILLGYATNLGGIYLGTWYTGNIARTTGAHTETVQVATTWDIVNERKTAQTTTTNYNAFDVSSNNQIEVLIGVAGMGIKVGFFENVTTRQYPTLDTAGTNVQVQETFDTGTKEYTRALDSYSFANGRLIPYVTWGGDFGLIRPYVTLKAGINQDNTAQTLKNYTTVYGNVTGAEQYARTGNSSDYFAPSIEVGAELDLAATEDATTTLDFAYAFAADMYDNSYDASGFSGSTPGTVAWTGAAANNTVTTTLVSKTTAKNTTLTINDQSSFSHNISIGFYTDKQIAEGLKIGLYAQLPVNLSTTSQDQYTKTLQSAKVQNINKANSHLDTTNTIETITYSGTDANGKTDTTSFQVAPEINLGASYALFPGRFTINAGIHAVPFIFTNTVTKYSRGDNRIITTTKNYDANGKLTNSDVQVTGTGTAAVGNSTDRTTAANTWGVFTASAWGGFVFNFNSNMALDMCIGAGGAGSNTFTLNISNVNVLFTFKF